MDFESILRRADPRDLYIDGVPLAQMPRVPLAARPPRFAIGDVVYPGYTPQKAGKVIAINPYSAHSNMYIYTVKRPNGDTYDVSEPSSFDELVETTRRKLTTHEALLAKIQAMP